MFLLEIIAYTTAPARTSTATQIRTIVIISLSESGVTVESLTVNVLFIVPSLPASSSTLIVTVYSPAVSISNSNMPSSITSPSSSTWTFSRSPFGPSIVMTTLLESIVTDCPSPFVSVTDIPLVSNLSVVSSLTVVGT